MPVPTDVLTFQYKDDGIILNTDPTTPFVDVESVDGLDNAPYRTTERDFEGADGGFVDAEFEKIRTIVLEGTIYDTSTHLETFLDQLKANFAPSTDSFPFYWVTPNVGLRRILVKSYGIRYKWTTDRRLGVVPFQIILQAEAPAILGPETDWGPFIAQTDLVLGRSYDKSYDYAYGSLPPAVLFPGTGTTYIDTPDTGVLDITGDIDIRAKISMDDWTPAGDQWIISKAIATGTSRSYAMFVDTLGKINLLWSADGNVLITKTSSIAVTFANGQTMWIRAILDVNNGAAGNDVKFYTSPDGLTWFQLGTTVTTAGTTSIFSGNNNLEIGARSAGTTNLLIGKFYQAEIRNGIDGTVVTRPTASGTSVDDNVGFLAYTLHGNASHQAGGAPQIEGSITVNNGGNRPGDAVLTITGDLSDPKITQDATGRYLQFDIDLQTSDRLVIDTRLRTVFLNGVNRRNALVVGSGWFKLIPGVNFLRFQASTPGAGVLLVTTSDAYR